MINVIVRELPSKYLFFRSGQPTRITSTNPDVDTVTGRALSKRGTDHPKMMVGMIGAVDLSTMRAWGSYEVEEASVRVAFLNGGTANEGLERHAAERCICGQRHHLCFGH